MFVFSPLSKGTSIPTSVTLEANVNSTLPHLLHIGPVTLRVLDSVNTPQKTLVTSDQKDNLTFQVAQ
jgi:hypothetical protein